MKQTTSKYLTTKQDGLSSGINYCQRAILSKDEIKAIYRKLTKEQLVSMLSERDFNEQQTDLIVINYTTI